MIRLIIKQGISKYSTVRLSYFGYIICEKNNRSAYLFRNLVLSLLNKV